VICAKCNFQSPAFFVVVIPSTVNPSPPQDPHADINHTVPPNCTITTKIIEDSYTQISVNITMDCFGSKSQTEILNFPKKNCTAIDNVDLTIANGRGTTSTGSIALMLTIVLSVLISDKLFI